MNYRWLIISIKIIKQETTKMLILKDFTKPPPPPSDMGTTNE